MKYRNYDPKRDKTTVHRILREVGWLEKGKEGAADLRLESARAIVADVDNEAECLVTALPGTIRYLNEELPFSGIADVATSRIARRQGLAKGLTAVMVAIEAAEGALVSGLGMFEQGYYNQLGFGTGSYEHFIAFDPSQLNVGIKPRVSRRITTRDWAMVHASRLARLRGHGSCNLNPPETTRMGMFFTKNGFGLGYCDSLTNELTHHFWCEAENVEQGPYSIKWMTFRTPHQFLELMALIRNLGDQVRLVKMREPPGIQLQDLLEKPFKQYVVTEKSEFENAIHARAYWQVRICDLPGCMARTNLPGDEVRFNLRLSDPLDSLLDKKTPWHGSAGNYVVTLGPSSSAETGTDRTLSTLRASVASFTRMWLGVRPATALAVTDQLSGPQGLLEKLDWTLRLPDPKFDWDF
ncbi:MAG: GNAT family N-acetyltransferase [bacterium]